jgi:hypothetical protein
MSYQEGSQTSVGNPRSYRVVGEGYRAENLTGGEKGLRGKYVAGLRDVQTR